MTTPPVTDPTKPALKPHPSAAAFWMAQLTQLEFERVIKEVGEDFAKQFRYKRETLLDALHLRKLPPEDRLVAYRMKKQDMWTVLFNAFPQRYRENMVDWKQLEVKYAAGEMDEFKLDEAVRSALQSAAALQPMA